MTTRAVGIRRLLKLAGILDTADARHRMKKERVYGQMDIAHPCGTPACALGHWAFNERRRWRYQINTYTHDHLADGSAPTAPVVFAVVQLKTRRPQGDCGYLFEDAINDFGITTKQAYELFDIDGCGDARTAKQAARYIRKFVKRLQKEAA